MGGMYAPVSTIWSTDAANAELTESLLTPPDPVPFWSEDDLESPNLDTRHDAKMRIQDTQFFAQVSALTPAHFMAGGSNASMAHATDWTTEREWFDERVRAARRHDLEDGRRWTDPKGLILLTTQIRWSRLLIAITERLLKYGPNLSTSGVNRLRYRRKWKEKMWVSQGLILSLRWNSVESLVSAPAEYSYNLLSLVLCAFCHQSSPIHAD
ncbi:hypothetical protein DXG03_004738 [Asterophora parasitica]|uniref:Uncharacterized protein n=1 Tax=Asterophora parasitica TaxID=117018 RepID=A0A9P7G8D2_9AGAR|nr:hypothetical protein DXG03_004738 [Asterophora parasitica]